MKIGNVEAVIHTELKYDESKVLVDMCKVMEDMRNDTAERILLQSIKKLIENMKWTAD